MRKFYQVVFSIVIIAIIYKHSEPQGLLNRKYTVEDRVTQLIMGTHHSFHNEMSEGIGSRKPDQTS